ncbi:hypothetical protein DEV91_13328 [Phyllobacterium brassicacearum]|nr:hypothetical protein DEV91_13328 [Phyllobacterium brassicacearum]
MGLMYCFSRPDLNLSVALQHIQTNGGGLPLGNPAVRKGPELAKRNDEDEFRKFAGIGFRRLRERAVLHQPVRERGS